MGNAPASFVVPADTAGARVVAPGVWRLRLPLPWVDAPHVNAYALDAADGGTVLIDTGGAGDESAWEALVRALAQAGRGPEDVVDVVVTHLHCDHAGFAGRLRERSGCRLWLPSGRSYAIDAVTRLDDLVAARRRCARREGVPEELLDRHADMTEELLGIEWPLSADRELTEGAEVPTALGPLRVIATPGHTADHLALVGPDAGLAFTGDLFSAVYAGSFELGYDDDPVTTWLGSLDRVARLDAAATLPGHGRPITDLPRTLAINRAGLRVALAGVVDALADGPCSAYELFGRMQPAAVGSEVEPWRFGDTLAYLRHLERHGRIGADVDDAGVRRYAV